MKNWLLIVIFIMSFQFCDAFIASMINPFLINLGFSLTEIAVVAKTFGLFATIAGSLLGGIIVHYFGITTCLFIGGFLQMFSNLMFIVQAEIGHDITFLYFTIAAENACGGVGSAAIIAYISKISSTSAFSGTLYALLSSIPVINMVLLPMISGIVADNFGYTVLFKISIILGLPSLLLLIFILFKQKFKSDL